MAFAIDATRFPLPVFSAFTLSTGKAGNGLRQRGQVAMIWPPEARSFMAESSHCIGKMTTREFGEFEQQSAHSPS